MKINILDVTIHQLQNNFCLSKEEEIRVKELSANAEKKAIKCIEKRNSRYFHGEIDPFNSVMNCNYLYWLSHLAFLDGDISIADKIYYLNKLLNSVELFYEIELPEIWFCEHPLGSVMGKAKYGNNFFFFQGCTVGYSPDKEGNIYFPVIGNDVIMYSNSKILGNSKIGDHVIISANAYIKNRDIPNNSIVFGQSPNLTIKNYKNKD